MADPVMTRMTAAEFLELPETMHITQLIDGQVIVWRSQTLDTLSLIFARRSDGTVSIAPTDVYFDDFNVVQPDVLWISGANTRCIVVDGRHFKGAPDLIVEVLSPGTTRIDRKNKFDLYEKYGVHETFKSPLLGDIVVRPIFEG
jgi:Uma2 family endonuclease